MTTKLDKELRREIEIDGKAYTVTLSPKGVRVTEKGRRKGQELDWKDMVAGQAASAVASDATLDESQ